MFKRGVSIIARLLALVIVIAPLIPLNAAFAQIDNCCFVDRHCATNEDWVQGYWAYQNNQCAVPLEQQLQRQQSAPAVDNCCFVNRHCATNEDWVQGYWAYQNNQCAVSLEQQQQGQQGQQLQDGNQQQAPAAMSQAQQEKQPARQNQQQATDPQATDAPPIVKTPEPQATNAPPIVKTPVKVTEEPGGKKIYEYDDGVVITRPLTKEEWEEIDRKKKEQEQD